MKATLQQMTENLGLDRQPGPYDSRMWTADNMETGTSCTAMMAMNAEGDEIEVTVDLNHTTPKPETPEQESIMYFHIKRDLNQKWSPDILRVKGEALHSKLYDWEKKACDFFLAVTVILNRSEVPDIDELIERIFRSNDQFGSGTAGGGKRNPTIRPEQILNPMKRF
jgi:hypothetical protein